MAIQNTDIPTKVFDVTIYIKHDEENNVIKPSHDHLKHYTQQYCKHWDTQGKEARVDRKNTGSAGSATNEKYDCHN